MELKRVVITGLGTVNPLGNNVEAFFSALDKGVSASDKITRFDASLFKTQFACEIKDFKPENFGINNKEARRLDRFSQYALAAANEAIADAGFDMDRLDLDRVGVILGSGIGGIETLCQEIQDYCEGGKVPRFSPFLITKMISDIAPGHISIKYGFTGPNYTTTSACASASHAIIDSFNLIRLGKADAIVTGGAEAPITVASVGGFNSAQALSVNNEEYRTASRPFDRTRDGFVLGEGAGILVLEELQHALDRGAKIYAELIGAGMTADAHHITAPQPDGIGASKVIRLALQDAGIAPEEVDYINVHGTSTPKGDIPELLAIKNVFGEHAYRLNISSTKSMHGHLLGAAAAIESIACIHVIRDVIVPPTINFKEEDPEIDYKMNLTLNHAQKRDVKVAIKNTFGFGGHNSCIVFRRYEK